MYEPFFIYKTVSRYLLFKKLTVLNHLASSVSLNKNSHRSSRYISKIYGTPGYRVTNAGYQILLNTVRCTAYRYIRPAGSRDGHNRNIISVYSFKHQRFTV